MARSQWTVLTYIAAHNNLAMFGQRSLIEIVNVGSTDDVVHCVLFDRHAGADRYVVGDAGTVREQQHFEEFDGGDPDALIETAKWVFGKYPAERYGIVLWSHGTGWTPAEIAQVATEVRPSATDPDEPAERAAMPGSLSFFRTTLRVLQRPADRKERAILFDDGSGHSLDTLELRRVTSEISDFVGKPLEFLGMDACLMGNIEVAYELRNHVRFLVASEELVPAHSWPYASIYGSLGSAPAQDGRELAAKVVDQYVNFYTEDPPGAGDVTKVALDLSKAEQLAAATRTLSDALIADMPRHADALWQAQHAARQQETTNGARTPNKFEFHLWDLGAVASRLALSTAVSDQVRSAAAAVRQALVPGDAVVAEGHHGSWFDGTAGVSIYLMPPGRERLSPFYAQVGFAQRTGWIDMLTAYHQQLG